MPPVRFTQRSASAVAGVLTSMAAGGTAMLMMAPHAVAESNPANPLQPVIDQLLDAQQQVTEVNSHYPFISASDLGAMLHEYTQNLASTLLASQLPPLTFTAFNNIGIPWAPYPWDAPATNMQQFLTLANPDDQYSVIPIQPNHTYDITVQPGPGTQDVTFTVNSGDGVTVDYHPLLGFNLAKATPNPDGSYTIVLSSTPQQGNWVDTAGGDRVILRDTVGHWGQIHDNFSIQEEGVSSSAALPLLSNAQISALLTTVAENEVSQNASPTYFGQMNVPQSLPDNTFSPIQQTVPFMPGPLLPGQNQISSLGHFVLQPNQALVIKVPDIDSAYSSAMVANAWGQTAAPVTATGNLNDTQAFHDPDGFTYYVISGQDPGIANWLNTGGVADGEVWLRWQGVTGPLPEIPVQAEVVNVADVKNEIGNLLPADTPLVTVAEHAAELQQRLFEWDYAHDQNNGLAWLVGNLEYDQIKAAMGADQFNEIFGGQATVFGIPQHVPSVLDRLMPALSPSLGTIGDDIFTHPAGSLSAIINNVPLALKDIELPIILALLRVQEVFEQTTQVVQSDIAAGDLWQALAALGTGVQELGGVFYQAVADPVTSITAGILNARDDLAVAIMNAGTGFAPLSESTPLWDSLIQLNQAVLQALMHTAPADSATQLAAAGTTLLDPADIAALGADLASNAHNLPLDLLP